MKHCLTLVLILIIVFPTFSQESRANTQTETTTYYFIRHAEKDRSDNFNEDPHLTEIGEMRANYWSSIFDNIPFDAVYSTDYKRTKETAQPTATKNNLELSIYSPDDINLETFLDETKGKNILIVGHSNTTPYFVNAIIGEKKYSDMEDDNNGNLYIVTIINDEISDQVLLIN